MVTLGDLIDAIRRVEEAEEAVEAAKNRNMLSGGRKIDEVRAAEDRLRWIRNEELK